MKQIFTSILKAVGLEKIVLFVLFLSLSIPVSKLKLYADDSYWIFPTMSGKYVSDFTNYIHYFGLFRPLKVIYYYFIFTLYKYSSSMAHLFPLVLVILSSYLLYRILVMRKVPGSYSFLISLVSLTLPFTLESYAWISANGALIAYFIFLLQIYLLERFGSQKRIFWTVLLLQFLVMYVYETTIVMPIAFGILWLEKCKVKFLSIEGLVKYFIFLLPYASGGLLFILLRWKYPVHIDMRNSMFSFVNVTKHWGEFGNYAMSLFSRETLRLFWVQYSREGYLMIFQDPLLLTLFTVFIFGALKVILKIDKENNFRIERSTLFFWLLVPMCSLVPLSFQDNYLPFRLLMLPTILLSLLFFLFIFKLYSHLHPKLNLILSFGVKIGLLGLVVYFLTLQVAMMNNYRLQYNSDIKIANEIVSTTSRLYGPHPYVRTNVYIKNLPNNMLWSFVYGDYLLTSYYQPWSGEYLINHQSGIWENVVVELEYQHLYKGSQTRDVFLSQRPLTIFEYTDKTSCMESRCLKLIGVYK